MHGYVCGKANTQNQGTTGLLSEIRLTFAASSICRSMTDTLCAVSLSAACSIASNCSSSPLKFTLYFTSSVTPLTLLVSPLSARDSVENEDSLAAYPTLGAYVLLICG